MPHQANVHMAASASSIALDACTGMRMQEVPHPRPAHVGGHAGSVPGLSGQRHAGWVDVPVACTWHARRAWAALALAWG